ncbi:dephospho-CoA kinase [Halanaerocella petrolearia]
MNIGLTGGIASGKSTVAQLLSELGVEVLDADKIAHQLMEPGTEVWELIVEEFGKDILLSSNEIDRKKLGDIIFNNNYAKEKLDEITHPFIIAEIKNRLEELRVEELVVVEVPLLIEANMMELFDEIWLVYVPQKIQVERLMARGDLDQEEALARIKSQMPLEDKKDYADRIIDNSGNQLEIKKRVKQIYSAANKKV